MNEKVVGVGYIWGQRLRLVLVILSPILFAVELLAALQHPRGFGWLAAGLFAAVGIYVASDYGRAKAAHELRPSKGRNRPRA